MGERLGVRAAGLLESLESLGTPECLNCSGRRPIFRKFSHPNSQKAAGGPAYRLLFLFFSFPS